MAEMVALVIQMKNRLSKENRERDKKRRERSDAEERSIIDWFDDVEAVARMTLIASGYRQHNRGEWRKSRGKADPSRTETQDADDPS